MGAPASAAGAAFSRPKMAEAGNAREREQQHRHDERCRAPQKLCSYRYSKSVPPFFQCGTVILCEKELYEKGNVRGADLPFPNFFQLVSHSSRERFFTPETMPMAAKSVTMDEPP